MKALLRKYNVPGPRYTSYPTVPYWDRTPTSEEWIENLSRSLSSARSAGDAAALYVHIPFCTSLCSFCGCNNRITRKKEIALPYIDSVLAEWAMLLDRLGAAGTSSRIEISEVHLGGGTPTFLQPEDLERLVVGILDRAVLRPGAELSIEVDPRVTTREHLDLLAKLGFKRISLGVQDFEEEVQQAVNRVQSVELVREITRAARERGFTSVNFDLIYGLPFQSVESVARTVERVCELRPDRIAFYGYAHVPWIKPAHRRFTEQDLPSGDEKRALYEAGREIFERAGYREIGMDHFALESDGLLKAAQSGSLHRNFMGYTEKKTSPLIGLGVSAISDSWTAFTQNEKVVEEYQRRVSRGELPIHRGHVLDEEDLMVRRLILDLMTRFETSWSATEAEMPALAQAFQRLSEPAKDGLVKLGERSCSVTESGRAFLRNIAMAFDARLIRKAPETRVFSQTV